jgi:hypothetical protein
MDGVRHPNDLHEEHTLHTQSDYQDVLHSQQMETLRNCSELHDGDDINIQPSQQPESLLELYGFLELLASEAAASEAATPEATTPEAGADDQLFNVDGETAKEIQFKFPTAVHDPGFVDDSTNQLVLSCSSDIAPPPTRSYEIFIEPKYNWSDLCASLLPNDRLLNILSAHAYNLFKVPKLIAVKSKTVLDRTKIYHCLCHNTKLRVRRVTNDLTPKPDRKWRIDPRFMQLGGAVVNGVPGYVHRLKKKNPFSFREMRVHFIHVQTQGTGCC